MIPVSIVTGFLGSGKTTLISRILHDPDFGRTAVIVNEFGEIALDHELIASSDDSVLTLSTGCLCCAVQSDLALTLMNLFERRAAGIVDFDRVLIETSGLSDLAPILHVMITEGRISETYRVVAVVTLVDVLHGEQALHDHSEARHQVALADRLLLSKTDVRSAGNGLMAQLEMLNPVAPLMIALRAHPSVLFTDLSPCPSGGRLTSARHRAGHGDVETFTVIREQPIPALALTLLLQAIAEHCGSRLLRLKGLVAIKEMPGRPAVIHGVRHAVSPPEFLGSWPSIDERTRIVFIVMGIPQYFVSRLLDAIEMEFHEMIAVPTTPSIQAG